MYNMSQNMPPHMYSHRIICTTTFTQTTNTENHGSLLIDKFVHQLLLHLLMASMLAGAHILADAVFQQTRVELGRMSIRVGSRVSTYDYQERVG